MSQTTDVPVLALIEAAVTDSGRLMLKLGSMLLLTYLLGLVGTLVLWRGRGDAAARPPAAPARTVRPETAPAGTAGAETRRSRRALEVAR